MDKDNLSKSEKELFDKLPKEKKPLRNLEKKVVNRLKEEQLINDQNRKPKYLKTIASVAAAIVLFLSGIAFERSINKTNLQLDPTKGYMLLLHEDEGFMAGDPTKMYQDYKKWLTVTHQLGVKISGQELKQETIVVDKNGVSPIEVQKKRTTGYFILEAESLQEAVQIARQNPHVRYGGSIEIKPYMIR